MPLYRFKVADTSGSVSEAVIEGENQNSALRRLKARKLTPITFLGEGEAQKSQGSPFSRNSFSAVEFTDRLVPLLDAGIPLEQSLGIIEDTMENPSAQTLVRNMRQGLHEGRKFSQLIGDRGRMFPRIYKNLVEVGEEAGALTTVLRQMRSHLNEKREMQSYLKSASIYPAIISFISLCVVLFMMGYIVPQFAETFARAKKAPSGLPALLFDIAYFVQNYWYIVLLLIITIVAVPIYMMRSDKYRETWDEFLLKLPVIRKIVIISNITTLVKTMAIMIRSGVHLLKAVQISARVIPNTVIRNSISSVASRLRQGERLSSALAESPYLPKIVTKMLAVGEETGNVEEMMERVGEQYSRELKEKIKGFLNAFEPLIIVVLGGVIGFIVVTMFLAISDLTNLG